MDSVQNEFVLVWAGEQTLMKQHLQMVRYNTHRHVLGNVPSRAVIWAKKGYIEKYFDEESVSRIREDGKCLLKEQEGQSLLYKTEKVIREYKQSLKVLLEKPEDRASPKLFREFESTLLELLAYFMTSTEHVTYYVEQELQQRLQNKYGNMFQEPLHLLLTPTQKNLLDNERESWICVTKKPSDAELKRHMTEFSFLFVNMESAEDAMDILRTRLSEKEYDILDFEDKKMKKRKENTIKLQKELYSQIDDKRVYYLSTLIKKLAVLRLDLKACWSGMHFSLLPLFKSLAEKTEVEMKDFLLFFTTREIGNLLEFNLWPSDQELNERRKKYLLYYDQGHIQFLTGEDAEHMKRQLIPEKNFEEVIYGTPASPGIVEGKSLILKTDNLRNIMRIAQTASKKDILVCGMTNPNMTPLIERVGGIVTDEGGLACHASLIAREFGIPCIVGCRTATNTIGQGDFLTLNATEGNVCIQRDN